MSSRNRRHFSWAEGHVNYSYAFLDLEQATGRRFDDDPFLGSMLDISGIETGAPGTPAWSAARGCRFCGQQCQGNVTAKLLPNCCQQVAYAVVICWCFLDLGKLGI